jgi:hypothetical protein
MSSCLLILALLMLRGGGSTKDGGSTGAACGLQTLIASNLCAMQCLRWVVCDAAMRLGVLGEVNEGVIAIEPFLICIRAFVERRMGGDQHMVGERRAHVICCW